MQYLKELIEKYCGYFVRPPRFEYQPGGFSGTLHDGTVRQAGSLSGLVYTYIQPIGHDTTVVYLHCSQSSQKEGLYLDSFLRPAGLALFVFDFEGCGNSKGQYITLGLKQADQILKVLTFIREKNGNKIVLWGRSMGATTVLRYLQTYGDENIVCAVVDSPYKSLRMLIYDMAPYVPNFILETAFQYICKINARKIGFDLSNFQVFSKMRQIQCPVLFLASRIDNYVPFGHTYDLFRHKRGKKQLIELLSSHSQPRSSNVTSRCVYYIQDQIHNIEEDSAHRYVQTRFYSEPEVFRI